MTLRLAFAMTLFAAPVAAAGAFSPPEGCTGFLTVQAMGCRVSNHYTCEKDPAGDKWRADFDQEGIFFLSHIDNEAQWVESYDMFPTRRQSLEPDAADPASFSRLLETGMDRYDFWLRNDDGSRSRVTGRDRLTGRSVTINGVSLAETEFDMTETTEAGNVLHRSSGNEYIHRDWRLFFAGPSVWEDEMGKVNFDSRPIDFIFPGEPGFFATEPIYGCEATVSRYTEPSPTIPSKEGLSNDDL